MMVRQYNAVLSMKCVISIVKGRGDMDPEPLYSIFESIQTGGSGCSGCDGLGRIVPADMWESPFAIDDFSNWVCYQVHKTSEGKLDTFLEKSIKKRKLPPGDNYESKAVPFKFDDRISDYLKDLIYVSI